MSVCLHVFWLVGWLLGSVRLHCWMHAPEREWLNGVCVCVRWRRCWCSVIVPGLMALFSRGIQYLSNKIQLLTENYGNAIINIRRKSNFYGNSQFERQKAQRFPRKWATTTPAPAATNATTTTTMLVLFSVCACVYAGKRIELRFIMLYCTHVSWINETYEVVLMWCEWNDVYGLLLQMGNGYRYCRVNINAIRLRVFSWQCPLFHC